ncbi:hypothetical protein Esi_0186_0052 [Ectocarpus siliculosus]|uniref:Uncharacterized protein n=1 Tax=Ectocarpus siliculosus TaxID=2880 RepID=D8LH35_ECTSI|nr:hypothetical protein Esi_0186_0052 [Ectocarpus siliculosus]|eukprot:CBN75888.1 hypothetical protein Esi_0186_0052 [Ectocarpus siliculosus]
MEMSGQNLFDALDTALVPKAAKAALLGLLLQLISPDVANMLGGESSKKTVGPGEKTARGVAANVMSVYAYGFVGPARMQFSGGGPTNALTNPFLALGPHAWPRARQNLNTFPAIFVKAVVSARSELHAEIRNAIAEFLIPLMEEEASTNNPMTGADLLRGVRERIMDVDPESEELTGLMSRSMWRFTKAHQASTRKAITLGYLLGPERLKEDFLGQFMTGPRRCTATILTIPSSDFHKPEIMRFLAPYYVEKDSLVVPETPAADVYVQDDDLEAYLNDMF